MTKKTIIKKASTKPIIKEIVNASSHANEPTAKEGSKVVKARPLAKAIEKPAALTPHDASKPGVHLAKKIQTAEGWKRDQIKKHSTKKTKQ
jgi:hypothetical protein